MSENSRISDAEWKYPQSAPSRSGWLEVSAQPPHLMYWEEYGNPKGEPVIFIHGGPGGGTTPTLSRFFDPKRYRIILYDQRGCGKSLPSAADDDAAPALADNTTAHLVGDIAALRAALGIEGKMHVFGGSWGSTLALAYAIRHPQTVRTLILRGIFLCRRQDLDYFYQGNAAMYADNPQDSLLPGAYMYYPQAWKTYVEAIPAAERGDMVAAYAHRFAAVPANVEEEAALTHIARAWSLWEGVTSYLTYDPGDPGKFGEERFARAFARIENHYFMNGAFLDGSGEEGRKQDYLLQHCAAIRHIPIHIVHGRYDQVCPLFQAEALVAALRHAGARQVDYRVTCAGHSMMERENNRALTETMDGLPQLS
jgi:proline iminopeptidase